MFQLVTSSNQPPGHLCNKRVLGGLVCWLPGKPIHIANALLARGIEAQRYTLSQSGHPSHASAHLNHLQEPVYANLYYSYQCLLLPVSHIVVISVPLSAVSWVPCNFLVHRWWIPWPLRSQQRADHKQRRCCGQMSCGRKRSLDSPCRQRPATGQRLCRKKYEKMGAIHICF